MRISEFQRLMDEIYGEKDRERGPERTLLWLVEEVGELAEAVRRGDEEGIREELADVIAWAFSLANVVGVDVEELLREKYPGKCPKCGRKPCRCGE
ncbi:MazG nucleotide pyrophosphohydrolase domain-containing protein [Methanopyrus sp.]|jgi:NTP pyrophosphatase (non-canonical NTP hydrolase)